MDIIKEFLESSTIHGLYYISASRSRLTKIICAIAVIIGFTLSAYLINNSIRDWKKSPVSSDISTQPMSQLDFPKITVCPPHGSYTALNYDLMKADNDSLTYVDKANLITEARNIFILEPLSNYAEILQAEPTLQTYALCMKGIRPIPL